MNRGNDVHVVFVMPAEQAARPLSEKKNTEQLRFCENATVLRRH